MDRLRHLEDKDAHKRLQVSAEVPMSIRIKDTYGNNEMVKGRADWAIGYGTEKSDTGAILLVVEAKPYESAAVGMPQLLVYMAAVHEARVNRINLLCYFGCGKRCGLLLLRIVAKLLQRNSSAEP